MADDSEKGEEESSNKSELTAKQKRNKKKAAKRKKQEQREKNEAPNSQQDTSITSKEATIQSPQEKFEEELAWCISQLEIGLKVQKPDKNTASHTEQIMKNLRSPKVLLPKKRQIMHSVFGDYRKKIQEETKLHKLPKEQEQSVKVFPVKKDQQRRSVFLRVSQDKDRTNSEDKPSDSQETTDQVSENSKAPEWKFESSSSDFKFNFDIQPT